MSRSMKFVIDCTINEDADPLEVAEDIHDYLGREDEIVNVITYDEVRPMVGFARKRGSAEE